MFKTPGLLTDQANAYSLSSLVTHGYEWYSYQVVNPNLSPVLIDYDLTNAKNAGMKNVGVWGISYNQADFFRDGKWLGEQAVKLGAQHVMADIEECLKFTRPDRSAQPYINGVRAGGWTGPVHLTTLGAPVNPLVNDYGMDVDSFLQTGGGIFPQEYYNEYVEYRPDLCNLYWTRIGVDPIRINHMIALYGGIRGRIDGAGWVSLLQAAGAHRNISVYMAQHGNETDYLALEKFTKQVLANTTRTEMVADARRWEAGQPVATPRGRITLARRMLDVGSTDIKWKLAAKTIEDALNKANIQ